MVIIYSCCFINIGTTVGHIVVTQLLVPPVATKVAVDEYFEGFCEVRLQDEAVPWGDQQVPAYPLDGITVLLTGVGGVQLALVDGVRQLGSGYLS